MLPHDGEFKPDVASIALSIAAHNLQYLLTWAIPIPSPLCVWFGLTATIGQWNDRTKEFD